MIWNKTIRTSRNKEYEQLAAFMSTTQLWQATHMQRVSRNAVYMCRGSKDARLSNTEKVVTRLPCMYQTQKPSRTKLQASYATTRSHLTQNNYLNVLTVMIVLINIFCVFYFHGLGKPRKYFYSENFQIYGMSFRTVI